MAYKSPKILDLSTVNHSVIRGLGTPRSMVRQISSNYLLTWIINIFDISRSRLLLYPIHATKKGP